jgi:hypothetical protein
MRWARHAAHMARVYGHSGLWWENMRDRDLLEDTGVYWWIILKRIFKKWKEGHDLD